jgi:hypothetical protein
MYYFTRLSHIVDEFILPVGMRVWVVCTHTRTGLPDGYMMLPIYVPAGRNIIPYPSPYRVKPVGYSGFGYPLPSLTGRPETSCCEGTQGQDKEASSERFLLNEEGPWLLQGWKGRVLFAHSTWVVEDRSSE